MATIESWDHQDGRDSYNHYLGNGLLIFSAFYNIIMEHAELIFDGMPEEERRIVKSLLKSDPDLITDGPEFSGLRKALPWQSSSSKQVRNLEGTWHQSDSADLRGRNTAKVPRGFRVPLLHFW
jgi:hypothetical protein